MMAVAQNRVVATSVAHSPMRSVARSSADSFASRAIPLSALTSRYDVSNPQQLSVPNDQDSAAIARSLGRSHARLGRRL